jgi:hypothetical protein
VKQRKTLSLHKEPIKEPIEKQHLLEEIFIGGNIYKNRQGMRIKQ